MEAAQIQAAQIKAAADKSAVEIIAQAQAQAQKIIEQAQAQAQRTSDSTQAALEQAGRDLLISLKQEIISMLERLIRQDLKQALSAQELFNIIAALIKNAPLALGSQIVISLQAQDKEKLEQGFLKQLIAETKKSIVLKSAEGIESGFVISFDGGRSIFDFSAGSLSEYICGYLRPELSKILNSK